MRALKGRPLPAVATPAIVQSLKTRPSHSCSRPNGCGDAIHENTKRWRWSVTLEARSPAGA